MGESGIRQENALFSDKAAVLIQLTFITAHMSLPYYCSIRGAGIVDSSYATIFERAVIRIPAPQLVIDFNTTHPLCQQEKSDHQLPLHSLYFFLGRVPQFVI